MNQNFQTALRIVRNRFIRHAWTSTQQRWTTSFVVAGLILATIVMPSFGIAVFGTAFAGWWLAVFIMTGVCGLVGNRVGIGREKARMMRQAEADRGQ
ncbi:hypothetical protein EN742_20965 [Mesorhizobium sp. M4A.F.Ca.ET.020.02.1.1]|uniref:hypothetical protein n=1 Tax=unclassified Mesorhizobium TaxID=325217 RepID=UPI000FD539B5|nr:MULTISPECIES: hypothetical protein [unclassified Mesorhizobium]RVD37110.1 hypothetical protein EN742_20965 [Mesorhizobium sp. M4A.F.Ca.ET.020.02.1.1]RWC20879.1 MAG: hypothetical protein EOS53_07965 [Mesorhizobium sp.]